LETTSRQGICIQTDNLGKRFNREWIFRRLSLSFESGHTYAITGPNGSGKSTFLQILWGQSIPSAGTVKYLNNSQEVAVEDVFRRISIATPYMDLIDEFTLQEQLEFHFKFKRMRAGASVESIIETIYLENARNKQIGNFSSGMRQRLKLGLAFYTAADIVFLDEPGTNLDQHAFSWYLAELQKLPENTLIFIASNNPAEYPRARDVINIMNFK
jgi:ABC-type multidrug transport system ATPase subunit